MNANDKQTNKELKPRPPIVAVMGHIDHGKSTLLDTIRKTNVVEKEAGGITQHLSAYIAKHTDDEGSDRTITFLDTPGHAAFASMRSRGADVADVAILVIAADDGVQEQTLEAHRSIQHSEIPFVVALNKTDKPEADVQSAINDLIENEIYVEGHGGDIPYVEISAKTGDNIGELLDVILLIADVEELSASPSDPATGVVIETAVESQRGTAATLIVRDGTLEKGEYVQAGEAWSPTRIMEDFLGNTVKSAGPSDPVKVVGFNQPPEVGAIFNTHQTKGEARDAADSFEPSTDSTLSQNLSAQTNTDTVVVPVVVKADAAGTVDALKEEIDALSTERAKTRIVKAGAGDITEDDIRSAEGSEDTIIVGFNVDVSPSAATMSKQAGIEIKTASVIYELSNWLEEALKDRTPLIEAEKIIGRATVLKTFSKRGNTQVVGGKVLEGTVKANASVTIMRQGEELAKGVIKELQQQKVATESVSKGQEFGMQVETRVEIVEGDTIESFVIEAK